MTKAVYLFLTQVTIVIHLLFIVFVVTGGFYAHKIRSGRMLHVACLAWAVYAELANGVVCPLTALENNFALRAGLMTYQDDFIMRYLVPVIYQEGVGPALQYLLVVLVLIINVAVYSYRIYTRKER